MYCSYYHAQIVAKDLWFLTGCLRNAGSFTLERTIDKENSILEFFVPRDQEDEFVSFMEHFKQRGIVVWFEKKENRLEAGEQL